MPTCLLSLLMVLAACTPPADTDTPGDSEAPEDTAQPEDSAPPDDTAAPLGTDDPEWWVMRNTQLDLALQQDLDGTVGWELLFYTSEDGVTWQEHPDSPIAYHFSTLGLFFNDVGLAITGFPDWASIQAGDMPIFRAVYALTTLDLTHWSVRAWTLDDDGGSGHDMLVDPQFELGNEAELGVWYYAFPFSELDPAIIPGDHDICRATFTSEQTLLEQECPLQEEYLADPSPLMHEGKRWVATTQQTQVVLWDQSVDPPTKAQTWPGTVPYLTPWPDGSLRLWYQGKNEHGGVVVAAVQSDDGGTAWSEPTWPLGEEGACTSPVAARFKGTWVAFCAKDQSF